MEGELAVLRGAMRVDKEELAQFNKNLVQEKNKNTRKEKCFFLSTDLKSTLESQKRLNSLQKRVDVYASEAESEAFQNKLRNALTDLVKENEGLRRINMNKERDIEKLADQIYKLKWKNNRTQRRLDKINNRESIFQKEDDDAEDEILVKNKDHFKNATQFFKGKYVPKTLDFRIEYLQEEYYGMITFVTIILKKDNFKGLLNDIVESGSTAFTKHILSIENPEEQREGVKLITSQYMSFRQFSEKLNALINHILSLISMHNIDSIVSDIATNLRSMLNAERVQLWMSEPVIFNLLLFE